MAQSQRQAAEVIGAAGARLSDLQVTEFILAQLASERLDGRSVCVLIPDATRSCPLPMLISAIHEGLRHRVSRLTVLVALGTHAPMTEEELAAHLGYQPYASQARYPGMTILNHEWWKQDALTSVGTIDARRIGELSEGRLHEPVDVAVNRAVVEHDVTLVVGPVFPHEVVGFSGGNKYFFPGVSGQRVIDVSHWLGALISSAAIIGTKGVTPVRALIDEATNLIATERLALCIVVESGTAACIAAAFGDPQAAWERAADVSAEVHIRYLDAPVHRVLSLIPAKYDDMWTAAKGFYKVEPIVADGGQVVLYAPHVREISRMHPELNQIGYHCRDYFVQQWDRFKDLHWGVLAHSTHLRGAGTYDAVNGERCRVTVTLATGIPEEIVRGANLDYLDPATIDATEWARDPQTLVVPQAGEVLFRLR